MKITVDEARCAGHAQCWREAAELYTLTDDGYSALTGPVPFEVPAGYEERARAGAEACPEIAITLLDD